ncbi:hypothetical protein PMIN03_001516 [Paraphaeosphaeria minitans]|uniref:Uncharacterized protein n=1 Tax=Paraphaeosphaeria minitans TaxID=565426 RepID=A0A9P6GQC3_9PLEO|nr:hypothetical protein PMIN01_02105 [Paraphaeosphaeria minitans]
MPYLLFKPRHPFASSPFNPPRPKYATNDRAVAQVFYSYGWVVMHAPRLPTKKESAIWWDSDSNDDDDETAQNEIFSSTRQCSGIEELDYQGVVLDGLIEGPQVEEQVKWAIMWVADWDMNREVDLKVVLRAED